LLREKWAISPIPLLIPRKADLGRLSLSPEQGKFKIGENFTVEIILEAKNSPVNGSDIVLNFDPNFLTVEESKAQTTSLFPIYPRNWVNNENGEAILTGLATSPAKEPFVGPQLVGSLTFKGLKEGVTQVSIVRSQKEGSPSSTIIKAQGSQNILSEVKGGKYEILP
jgi:hypothetical protein